MKKQEIVISLKNNSDREQVTKKLLEQVLDKYSLDKWILCNEIKIEEGANGNAFPSITLSAWNENKEGLLAQFVHEQLHWIEKGREEKMGNAIEELKKLFPGAPINRPEGGGTESSTYKHLIICRLEFLALKDLFDEEKAQKIVSSNKNYTWIRKTILSDYKGIDSLIARYFPDMISP